MSETPPELPTEDATDRRPFAGDLIQDPRGKEGRLFSIEGRGDVVVRRTDVDVSSPEALEQTLRRVRENRELFSSMAEIDGVRVASVEYAVGQGERGGESYAVVEKISGKALSKMDAIDEYAEKEIDEFFTHYFSHVLRVLREGGSYWSDMHLEQVVYGTRPGEGELHPYIVDLDPFVQHWMNAGEREMNPPKVVGETLSVLNDLKQYWMTLQLAEQKLVSGGKLMQARHALDLIVEELAPVIAGVHDAFVKEKFARFSNGLHVEERKSIAEIRKERWK